jgi:hypothetical protein
MNRQNTRPAYVSEQTINSLCNHSLYRYFLCCGGAAKFIVVDQASIHTSNAIFDKLEEWKERGLTIFQLPTYSPE